MMKVQNLFLFASIYLKNTALGTTSNTEGYFVFHIPVKNKSGLVVISAMGYSSIEKKPSSFLQDEQIRLIPRINQLSEVQLSASKDKVLSAKDIVKRAYKNIETNYPTGTLYSGRFCSGFTKRR